MTISETLRERLKAEVAAGVSIYAISKATGINQSILGRFLKEERKELRASTIDALAAYFGLSLTKQRKRRQE